MRSAVRHCVTGLLLPGLLLSLAACSGKDQSGAKRGPPQVGFVVVQRSAVPIVSVLGGRTVAYEESEVRPQVTGLLRRRFFTEGGYVRAGQPLFQIDPSLYQAAVNEASANLQAARATAEANAVKARRFRPLADMEAIAKQDYTDALAQSRQAQAAVAQNAAQLDTARINLRFTNVPAPISGRIGRQLSTVGALVSANQTDPLAVIQRLDPIYVDMQQSSADLVRLRRGLASGGAQPGSAAVKLKLEDGSDYGYTGTVRFAEMLVNQSTGTVTLRASFPNPQNQLLPGMFVQAVFDQAIEANAILVPQAAITRDFGGDAYVMLVGANNKVVRRKVKADRTYGANWVIAAGLAPGDKVITQGTNNLKNGMDVRPVPAGTVQRATNPSPQGKGGGSGAPQAQKSGG